LLILIAALAVGLAWMRNYQHGVHGWEAYPVDEDQYVFPHPYLLIPVVGLHGAQVALWWTRCIYRAIAPVTLVVLVARFRQPRLRLRPVVRQPGTVGCAAAVLALIEELVWTGTDAIERLRPDHPDYDSSTLTYWDLDGAHPGLGIGVVWLWLAVSGRWKPERDWVDRAGVGLSLFWLIVAITNWPM
jgi:hypothetical protein